MGIVICRLVRIYGSLDRSASWAKPKPQDLHGTARVSHVFSEFHISRGIFKWISRPPSRPRVVRTRVVRLSREGFDMLNPGGPNVEGA